MGKTIELYGFPITVKAADVRKFVENFTGEGTIQTLKVRHGKGRVTRAFAIIQFTTEDFAESMMLRANYVSLRYRTAYLKARVMERDIEKISENVPSLEGVKLYFGCQISKERFAVLERMQNVSLSFGSGKGKVVLKFSHNFVQYKIQLSYQNIRKVELLRPRDKTARYLLVQLLGAPRIFEYDACTCTDEYDKIFPLYNYYKDVRDEQWTRTTYFTTDCCIGHGQNLQNFKDIFANYEESERQYTLQTGVPFSKNGSLVPIVDPRGVEIPFDILFKVNSLVQHVCLTGPALDGDFYRLVDPRNTPLDFIENALEKMYYSKEFCYDPTKWLTKQYKRYLQSNSKNGPRSPAISLDAGLVYVRRVQITPCKVYFCGPEINVSNRVLRHFHQHLDNFIRVSFVDEELDKRFSTDLSSRAQNKKTDLYTMTSLKMALLLAIRTISGCGGETFAKCYQAGVEDCWDKPVDVHRFKYLKGYVEKRKALEVISKEKAAELEKTPNREKAAELEKAPNKEKAAISEEKTFNEEKKSSRKQLTVEMQSQFKRAIETFGIGGGRELVDLTATVKGRGIFMEGKTDGRFNVMVGRMETVEIAVSGINVETRALRQDTLAIRKELKEIAKALGEIGRRGDEPQSEDGEASVNGNIKKSGEDDDGGGSGRTDSVINWRKKVELPTFEGSDPLIWIHRADRFFDLQGVTEDKEKHGGQRRVLVQVLEGENKEPIMGGVEGSNHHTENV
ncbi:hypothetical protein V8G54_011086 [Vigna mungo]|uniref:RNA-dependent RNA polymerase n=1 Tax=Vigna mungo TaxID=3915 RepID=A0AAQ3NPC7_VIGMU